MSPSYMLEKGFEGCSPRRDRHFRKKEDEVKMARGQPNLSDVTQMMTLIITKVASLTTNANWIF